MSQPLTPFQQLARRVQEQDLEMTTLRATIDTQRQRIAEMQSELDMLASAWRPWRPNDPASPERRSSPPHAIEVGTMHPRRRRADTMLPPMPRSASVATRARRH